MARRVLRERTRGRRDSPEPEQELPLDLRGREARPARTALFICEDIPLPGVSGASSYNLTVLAALTSNGVTTDVLVTSPRLRNVASSIRSLQPGAAYSFLHASVWRGRLVPHTFASVARWARASLRDARSKTPTDERHAVLGRRLRPSEIRLIRRMYRRAHFDYLVTDTIYRSDVLGAVDAERSILVAHDVFAHREQSFRANQFTVDNPMSAAEEQRAWQRPDAVLAISDSDAAVIRAAASNVVGTVYPAVSHAAGAGRDRGAASESNAPPVAKDILYVGAPAYHNVDGLRWFLNDVWPGVHEAHPSTRLHIVGGIADAMGERPSGTVFHGRVPDLDTVARMCRFGINPVRMGSGLKIKMVDYFELGLPCVVTPIGAEGFPLTGSEPFVIARSTDEMSDAVSTLLADESVAERLASSTSDYVRLFSAEGARDALHDVLTNLGPLEVGRGDR